MASRIAPQAASHFLTLTRNIGFIADILDYQTYKSQTCSLLPVEKGFDRFRSTKGSVSNHQLANRHFLHSSPHSPHTSPTSAVLRSFPRYSQSTCPGDTACNTKRPFPASSPGQKRPFRHEMEKKCHIWHIIAAKIKCLGLNHPPLFFPNTFNCWIPRLTRLAVKVWPPEVPHGRWKPSAPPQLAAKNPNEKGDIICLNLFLYLQIWESGTLGREMANKWKPCKAKSMLFRPANKCLRSLIVFFLLHLQDNAGWCWISSPFERQRKPFGTVREVAYEAGRFAMRGWLLVSLI